LKASLKCSIKGSGWSDREGGTPAGRRSARLTLVTALSQGLRLCRGDAENHPLPENLRFRLHNPGASAFMMLTMYITGRSPVCSKLLSFHNLRLS
jgi:hypothetical protein